MYMNYRWFFVLFDKWSATSADTKSRFQSLCDREMETFLTTYRIEMSQDWSSIEKGCENLLVFSRYVGRIERASNVPMSSPTVETVYHVWACGLEKEAVGEGAVNFQHGTEWSEVHIMHCWLSPQVRDFLI